MLRRAVLLLVCLLGAVVSSPVPDNAKVLRLDANSFHASVASRRFVAVAFIAPWCAHCKRLEPEWQAAVRALAASGMRDITLATLDTTAGQENAAVAKQHDVRGFPDIRIFRHGDCSPGASETYKGPRTAAGVVTAMTRLFREKARVLKTADEALVFVNSSPVAVLGVFAEIDVDENKYENGDEEASRRAFDKAARHFAFDADSEDGEYDVPFGVVFDRSLVPTQDFDEELKNDGAEHGDVFVCTCIARFPNPGTYVYRPWSSSPRVTFTSTGNCVIHHTCTVRPDYYDCLLIHITKYTHTRRLTLFLWKPGLNALSTFHPEQNPALKVRVAFPKSRTTV